MTPSLAAYYSLSQGGRVDANRVIARTTEAVGALDARMYDDFGRDLFLVAFNRTPGGSDFDRDLSRIGRRACDSWRYAS